MLQRITKVMGILFIDFFMIRLKEAITGLGRLMFIGSQKYLQILLTNVLLKEYHLLGIMVAF